MENIIKILCLNANDIVQKMLTSELGTEQFHITFEDYEKNKLDFSDFKADVFVYYLQKSSMNRTATDNLKKCLSCIDEIKVSFSEGKQAGLMNQTATIIVLFEKDESQTIKKLFKAGIDDFLKVPFKKEELKKSILNSVEKRTKRDDVSDIQGENILYELSLELGSTKELSELLQLILNVIMREMKAQQSSILLYEKESENLKMLASIGLSEEIRKKGYIKRKGSIAEWVIEHNEPLIINDLINDERFTSVKKDKNIKSSMCVPLQVKGKVIGTVNISRTEGQKRFTQNDLRFLTILASQAAIVIENARLIEDNIQKERIATVGQTLAGISHHIKNILTGLKGGLSITELSIKSRDWEILNDGWQMLKRNINRISNLVMDMLDFSKEKEPVKVETNINELINDACEIISFKAQNQKIIIQKSLQLEGVVPVDPDQIYRSVLNLITNAIDSMPMGGTLDIKTYHKDVEYKILVGNGRDRSLQVTDIYKGKSAIIEISDTGTGIPEELYDEIFKPFFSSKGSKGTGIGLAVTKKIIEEHKGKIEFESTLGKGTTFRIYLPFIKL